MNKLSNSFYQRQNVLNISKDILGKLLCTKIDGEFTAGIITDIEAYRGLNDKASHAYNNKKTNRTKIMYEDGGITYVYICYGIHYLLNIITNKKNTPDAILIRGIKPVSGLKTMMDRRNNTIINKKFTSGPATVTQALGVNLNHNNTSLQKDLIWIEDIDKKIKKHNIISSTRIGIDYAGDDALLPYRFYIKNIDEL